MEKQYREKKIHMTFQYSKKLYSLQKKCRLKLLKVKNWNPSELPFFTHQVGKNVKVW